MDYVLTHHTQAYSPWVRKLDIPWPLALALDPNTLNGATFGQDPRQLGPLGSSV